MSLRGEQVLLRAYLQSADRAPLTPTYERLVKASRSAGLAGATVLRGIMGFGSDGFTVQSVWSLVEHVPIIVEIVDTPQKIEEFVQGPLEQLMHHGMITLERASVMMYRQEKHEQPNDLRLGPLLAPLENILKVQAGDRMTINENGVLLRVFAGESDQAEGRPLHESILLKARQLGLAGGTVLRGIEGFGANSIVHRAHLLEMSSDLPIVIEIVDTEEKLETLLPYLEQVVQEGMITMERVAIIFYRHNPAEAPGKA